MKHIRKKDSSIEFGIAYTVVITDGYGQDGQPPLEDHPSIQEHPEIFEIADVEIPTHYQTMIYQQA